MILEHGVLQCQPWRGILQSENNEETTLERSQLLVFRILVQGTPVVIGTIKCWWNVRKKIWKLVHTTAQVLISQLYLYTTIIHCHWRSAHSSYKVGGSAAVWHRCLALAFLPVSTNTSRLCAVATRSGNSEWLGFSPFICRIKTMPTNFYLCDVPNILAHLVAL